MTFEAKDEAAGVAAFLALTKLGLWGTGRVGKSQLGGLPLIGGVDADEWIVKNVHVGCEEGEKKIQEALKKEKSVEKVTFEGTGLQRTVRVVGKDIRSGFVTTLMAAGFTGESGLPKKK